MVVDAAAHEESGAGSLATTQAQDEMECRLFLDVVIRESAAILELLTGEDQALLVWGNALLVLDLGLHVLNGVGGLDVQSDGLAGQRLDEDLHTTTEAEHEMEGRLLLDVVVTQGAAILELLAREDESLLVGRDALLVLDLGLDILDSVGSLNIESDRLTGEGLDEDLHATAEAEDQVESGLLLDVIVGESAAVLQLLSGEDEALLVRRDAFLVLDLSLDVFDGVAGLDIEGDGLARESLDENLHVDVFKINYNLKPSSLFK